jgi:hypothetical protein
VHTPAADSLGHDGYVDAGSRSGGKIERLGLDEDFEHARRKRAKRHRAHGYVSAVSQLALEDQRVVSRRSAHACRSGPDHFEPRGTQPSDGEERDGATERHGQEHRPTERDDGREARGGAERDQPGAGHRHVERRTCRVKLHRPRPRAFLCDS